jgi:tetratricopeptide (TPR) repeat protein
MNTQFRKAAFLLILSLIYSTTWVRAQENSIEETQIDSLNNLFNEIYTADPGRAEKVATDALNRSIQSQYLLGEANSRSNLGIIYFNQGDHAKALETCFAALKIYDKDEKFQNTTAYGMVHIRLASALNMENDLNRSKAYSQKAIAIANKIKDKKLLGIAYELLGNNYFSRSNTDSALYYFNLSKNTFNEIGSFAKTANLENNIGIVYAEKEDYKQTLAHFERALSIYREHNQSVYYVTSFYNIGEIYHRLKSYNKALHSVDSAEYYAKKLNKQGDIIDIYKLKAQIYHQLGNLDSSAAYYEKTITTKDSLYNDTYKKELAGLQTKSDVYKKETENKLLTKDKRIAELYRNLAIAGIIALVVLLGFILLNQRLRIQRRVKNKLEEEVVLRTKEIFQQKETIFHTNLRLKLALNSTKFDSNFVVNTLSTVQHLVLQESPKEAQSNLAKLSHIMQYVLEKSPLERVSLAEELEMLEHYIQIEQLRLDRRFDYSIDVQTTDNTTIPALILQPFIENAITYGIAPSSGSELYLELQVTSSNNTLTITIVDNGVDRRKEKHNKHNLTGSLIGQERLDLLTHLTHKNHLASVQHLTTEDGKSAGTKVILQIPTDGGLVVEKHEHLLATAENLDK